MSDIHNEQMHFLFIIVACVVWSLAFLMVTTHMQFEIKVLQSTSTRFFDAAHDPMDAVHEASRQQVL